MEIGGSPSIPISSAAERTLARRLHYTRLLSKGHKGIARSGERLPLQTASRSSNASMPASSMTPKPRPGREVSRLIGTTCHVGI